MTDEQIAMRVALSLSPPPDGFYDDEPTETRYHFKNGALVYTVSKANCMGPSADSNDYITRARLRTWAFYRMLP